MRILIADGDPTSRLPLAELLATDGHDVLQSTSGQQALEACASGAPELVLLSAVLPDVDALEVARRIRTEHEGLAVVLVAGAGDGEMLAEPLREGIADDVLTRPVSLPAFRARIGVLERRARLMRTLAAQHDEVVAHRTRLLHEQEVARRLFDKIVHRGSLDAPWIRYLISPQAVFNGDLLVAAPRPGVGLHLMLGDFTGHGLPAALGAIPAAEIFYSMTAKGFSIGDIVDQINTRLCRILPTGVFMAATLLELDVSDGSLWVWNGGNPDVLVANAGGVRERVGSDHLPLGIAPSERVGLDVRRVDVADGDRVYAYSDGVIEATDEGGALFGDKRLEDCIASAGPENAFTAIGFALDAFRSDGEQSDDITLVELRVDPAAAAAAAAGAEQPGQAPVSPLRREKLPWRTELQLDAAALREVDPLPILLNTLSELQGFEGHQQTLYTVLSELYANALEHGVLRLDSTLKRPGGGFGGYYRLREQRLETLTQGRVCIAIEHDPAGRLRIEVDDSGSGFDHAAQRPAPGAGQAHGRGIALVESLCRELRFEAGGSRAVAIYSPDGAS